MSMRVPGGEDSCLESSSTVEVRTSEDASPSHTISTHPRCEASPLLRIFRSKEVVPKILEYEKALLVMKEHDYAKASERPEIIKLSSLLNECPLLCEDSRQPTTQPVDPMADLNTLLSTRKELVLFRDSLGKREDSVLPNHCREVIGMQIELIREQQEQLQDKDKELNTARKDKEQVRD